MPSIADHLQRWGLRLAGYRSRLVPTSIGAIHCYSREGAGTKPHVLLIHGFGSAASHFGLLMRLLRAECRSVLAIDLPGHGFSERPAALTHDVLQRGLLEALDQVHQEPSILVGNSLGGAAAVRYANARPEKVLAVILLSPGGAPMAPEELADLRVLFTVENRATAFAFLDRLFARPLGWLRFLIAPSIVRTFRDPLLRNWLASIRHDEFLAPSELALLPAPVRLVWGRQDRILPASGLAFFRAHLPPTSEVFQADGLGHGPHMDDPALTARLILDVRVSSDER